MLVWACIAPHGGELIPELADGCLPRMARTRAGMEDLGRRCREARPDTLVVYTPHGICLDGYVSVSVSLRTQGRLVGESGASVSARFPVHRALASALSREAAARGVPVAQLAYEEDGRPAPVLPLDWGALVPLWFMGAAWMPRPHVVVVCPSRSLSRRQLVAFGEASAAAAEAAGQRVALVCSADQGHGHAADGPYGHSPLSASYDRAYCRAVREGALQRLLHWRADWIEAALPDSFWQTLMLHGALRQTALAPELLTYEAPTYFGMACAAFGDERPKHEGHEGSTKGD